MNLSDAAFLTEVENFLISSDIPNLNSGDPQPQCFPTLPSSTRKSRRGSTKLTAEAKRELERAKDRKRRSAFRERRRIERENLRKEAENLTCALLQMQKSQQAKTTKLWRAVAQRQLQCRLEAENHQRLLCAAINAQTSVIQKLYCYLSERKPMKIENPLSQCTRTRTTSDAAFYETFLQQLDHIYAKTDKALQNCSVDATSEKWGNCRTSWRENGTEGFFLNTYAKVIPVGFPQALDNLWGVVQLPHRQEGRQHFSELKGSNNTLAFKFRVSRCITGRVVSMVQHFVARRYNEQGRHIFVWRSFSEGQGNFSGMHANETGWIELNPLGRGTLMRICVNHEPMHLSTVTVPEIDKFTGVVLDLVSDDGDEVIKRMEKLTLSHEN